MLRQVTATARKGGPAGDSKVQGRRGEESYAHEGQPADPVPGVYREAELPAACRRSPACSRDSESLDVSHFADDHGQPGWCGFRDGRRLPRTRLGVPMATNRRLRRGRFLAGRERDGAGGCARAVERREHQAIATQHSANLGLAAVLSLFVPGSGLIYAGRLGQGMAVLLLGWAVAAMLQFGQVFWAYSVAAARG